MCRLPLDGGLPSGPANMTSCLQGATAKSPFRAQHYDDEFLQFQYKIVPCNKSFRHDFATCPYGHAAESSVRRHPSAYLPFLCGATQHSTDLKEKCPFGSTCKYAHSHFELWLHPGRFRTKMCSLGARCKRPVCFFAHSEQELRVTAYSKLDTSAAVATQQLADMGQLLDANVGPIAFGGSSNSLAASDVRGALAGSSSLGSGSSSEAGRSGSGGNSPMASVACDEAAALAKLTASMAALNGPRMLNAGGAMAQQLQSSAYYAAAAAAVDASLSGAAVMPANNGLWGAQQQQQMGYGSYPVASPMSVLDAQLLGLVPAAAAPVGASNNDLWNMLPPSGAQWAPVNSAAATQQGLMLAQQQRQQHLVYNLAPAAPGLPMQSLLSSAGMDSWLQAAAPCGLGQQAAAPANTQALLTNQAVQQLLGML